MQRSSSRDQDEKTLAVCRLCTSSVPPNRRVALFSPSGLQHGWASRISHLLGIVISYMDGLPSFMCDKCRCSGVTMMDLQVENSVNANGRPQKCAKWEVCFSSFPESPTTLQKSG